MISFSRLKKKCSRREIRRTQLLSFLVSLCKILNPKFVSMTGKKCTKAQNNGDV